MRRLLLVFGCLIAVLPAAPSIPATASSAPLSPPRAAVPATFFGLHIHRAGSTTPWPKVSFREWRLWDSYTAWAWLEPKPSDWHFQDLDRLVDLAERGSVEVLLTLGMTPTWASARPEEKSGFGLGYAAEPRRMEDWSNYVRTVATRYKGRIHLFEIWNEPNLKMFYSGSMERMVSLAKISREVLKEVDPNAVVVSPSPTGGQGGLSWLDEYLAKGGGEYADVIGYHFYVSPQAPEAMAANIAKAREIMARRGVGDKPLWNTETGWFIANKQTVVKPDATGYKSKVLTEEEAGAYLARAYLINWASGVQRFYWYAWDNKEMGLTEADGKTVKSPAKAYEEIQKWLVGAKMASCERGPDNTWTSRLSRERGYDGWVVWNPDRTVQFTPPASWKVVQVRTLAGESHSLTEGAGVEIGPTPVLLERLGS